MTQFIYDKERDSPEDLWTTERLKEEAFINLCKIEEKVINDNYQSIKLKKYYRQARDKMYRIACSSPANPYHFVINISDFSAKVKKELEDYRKETDNKALFTLLKEVAGRFFENLDFAYYHSSVMRNLKVRLES